MSPKSHSHLIPPEKQPGHQPHLQHRDPPGTVIESHTVPVTWVDCKRCNGTGLVDDLRCPRCLGYRGEYR